MGFSFRFWSSPPLVWKKPRRPRGLLLSEAHCVTGSSSSLRDSAVPKSTFLDFCCGSEGRRLGFQSENRRRRFYFFAPLMDSFSSPGYRILEFSLVELLKSNKGFCATMVGQIDALGKVDGRRRPHELG